MTNETEIQARLTAIKVMESVKLRLEPKLNSNTYDTQGVSIYADSNQDVIPNSVAQCYLYKRDEPKGKLAEAIVNINGYIRDQLAPLIAEHKAKIKELL